MSRNCSSALKNATRAPNRSKQESHLLASRSINTLSPFFTSAAMMAGLPSKVTREPFISTCHDLFHFPLLTLSNDRNN